MSKLVRTILIIAFALFVIGSIVAIVAINRHPEKKTITKKTEKTTTTVTTQPAPTTPSPLATTPAPAPAVPQIAPAPRRATLTRGVITTFMEDDFSASASASAGINADGSAWANAEAN